ncbi:response regulator transcription factor, partial [Thiolapillus sp.]
MTKILVIEDDRDIAFLVAMHLRDQGSEVDICHDGQEGLDKALQGNYQLLILDLMLPGVDGLEICRQVRAMDHYTPILMLTARSSEMDRVLGLEIGADDYLGKPFSVRELVARVRAICRRMSALKQSSQSPPEILKLNGLEIDRNGRTVRLDESPLDLTAREFDLLWHFAEHPGQVFSRCQLLDAVWGYSHEGYEHTVNSHINRLRAKIEKDPSHPE